MSPPMMRTLYFGHPSRKLSKLDEPGMPDIAGEVKTNSKAMYSWGHIYMDEQS